MKNNPGARICITLMCFILGFMISMQFKSVNINRSIENKQVKRAEQLLVDLKNEQDKNKEISEKLSKYEEEIKNYENSISERSSYADALLNKLKWTEEELDKTKILASLTDVEGKGIIVTLDDSKHKSSGLLPEEQENYVIHDGDILMVTNELSDAGAEAISVNNERLIPTSEIRCAGSIISINNNRYSTPFVIKAIGNPDTMEAALKMRNGVVENLQYWGINVNIRKSDNVYIPKYDGPPKIKYIRPVDKEEN